jgi:cytochrome c
MKRCAPLALWGLSFALAAPAFAQDGVPARGQMIFESRCVACHSLDANRVGPALGTVFGRVAGKAPDYFYSKALGAATHVWTRDKLQAWLTNPEALVPGQGMGYSVEKAEDRQDVVAYLASLSRKTAAR